MARLVSGSFGSPLFFAALRLSTKCYIKSRDLFKVGKSAWGARRRQGLQCSKLVSVRAGSSASISTVIDISSCRSVSLVSQ